MKQFRLGVAISLIIARISTAATFESPDYYEYEQSPAQANLQHHHHLSPRQLSCRPVIATLSSQSNPISLTSIVPQSTTTFSAVPTTTFTQTPNQDSTCGYNLFKNPSFSGNDSSGASGPSLYPWTFDSRPDFASPAYAPGRVTPFSLKLTINPPVTETTFREINQYIYIESNLSYTISYYYLIASKGNVSAMLDCGCNECYRPVNAFNYPEDPILNTWVQVTGTFDYFFVNPEYDPITYWTCRLYANSPIEVHITEIVLEC